MQVTPPSRRQRALSTTSIRKKNKIKISSSVKCTYVVLQPLLLKWQQMMALVNQDSHCGVVSLFSIERQIIKLHQKQGPVAGLGHTYISVICSYININILHIICSWGFGQIKYTNSTSVSTTGGSKDEALSSQADITTSLLTPHRYFTDESIELKSSEQVICWYVSWVAAVVSHKHITPTSEKIP